MLQSSTTVRYFENKTENQPTDSKREKTIKSKNYSRGKNLIEHFHSRSKYNRRFEKQREHNIKNINDTYDKSEILLTETPGYIELDDPSEHTYELSQQEIIKNVDVLSATKYFNLKLPQFGPYTMDYFRNGRELLLGGRRGHLASIEWQTKALKFEINVGEAINCVKWLHTANMLAVGQKKWTYVYDNNGTELHCLKKLYDVQSMEFLPYHFLLASGNSRGFLTYLDISLGTIVANLYTGLGRINCMTQNVQNAVIAVGDHVGSVTFWSPNCATHNRISNKTLENSDNSSSINNNNSPACKPLARMLCHKCPITAIAIDPKGRYMATGDIDRNLHLWDLRNYSILETFKLENSAQKIAFSQNQLLAVGIGSKVEIYKDSIYKMGRRSNWSLENNDKNDPFSPYLIYRIPRYGHDNQVTSLQFCPFEDVLGIGHSQGFSSILVPGSGEANFDSFEANPFQTKSQRRETEVKALLGKIQPELITLETGSINKVNVPTLQEKLEKRNQLLSLKPRRIDIRIKKRKGKKTSATKVAARKQEILLEKTKEFFQDVNLVDQIDADLQEIKQINNDVKQNKKIRSKNKANLPNNALERFSKNTHNTQ